MSEEIERGGRTTYKHISEKQLKKLRRNFNTEVLYVPRGEIHKWVAINDTNGLLRSLLHGKKLSKINLQGRWRCDIAPHWKWNSVKLKDLRCGSSIYGSWSWKAICGKSTFSGQFTIREKPDKEGNYGEFSGIQTGKIKSLSYSENELKFTRKFGNRSQE